MKVLFVVSELTPMAKVGGLGDVAGALPKVLKKLGINVRIFLPFYQMIKGKKYHLKLLSLKKIKLAHISERIKIYQTNLPLTKVPVYLIWNKKYLSQGGIYFEKSAFVNKFAEIERFLFFSKAILEIFPVIKWWPDIIHCHDWHSAILPALVKLRNQNSKLKIKTLLTIHNLANQGRWNAQEIFNFLGLRGDELPSFKIRFDGKTDLNILQQGILNADLINTVSPSYAQEILTKKFGEKLEKTLNQRKKDLLGILNGLDTEIYSPEKDREIKVNYSVKTIERKVFNKKDLQRLTRLPLTEKPIFSFIGRLTDQKGSELIAQIAPSLIKIGCQFIFLGQGQSLYESQLRDLAKKYKKNVYTKIGFDEKLASKIYAGADMFLMPSRFEPCGLGQMIAMRYGTIPIVRAVGGLKDSVENVRVNGQRISGNGFIFKNYKKQELLTASRRALKFFKNKKNWRKIQENAMKKDFSWQSSAKKYLQLYKKISSKI
ncbi:MAG: glycogen synthase [Patescibacteria group bacterium]|nr:glycogen synthase [Patescibacteria group bacterium]